MSEEITGRQLAAARELIGLSKGDLARKAKIPVPALIRMETKTGEPVGLIENISTVRAVLELAGVEFITGDEPGIILRRFPMGNPAASISVDQLTAENDE